MPPNLICNSHQKYILVSHLLREHLDSKPKANQEHLLSILDGKPKIIHQVVQLSKKARKIKKILGMVSHEMSIITVFGHKQKLTFFTKAKVQQKILDEF